MKTSIKTVFLSSTARDLANYREKVYQAIEGLGYHCVRMEDFGARDTLSAEFCRRKIVECDLFVCLIGLCYGSTPIDSELSFTHQEYQVASEEGIPRFIFVSADNYFYPGFYREPDNNWQKQQDFRKQAGTEALYDTFTDPQELATKIVQAISNWMREHPENLLPASPALLPRLYHNLPQPDYTTFVGRQKELDWLRQRLAATDRAWQIVLAGIGGVGKSSLALSIAHFYRENYHSLPSEEAFEAIIWTSAKGEILTINGREKASLPGLVFRTLEDIYTTIAQTLEREDITRATTPEEQDRLVQKILKAQRTLLIIDNLESVADERVRTFLYNLPVPTKCIITSREWLDVAAVRRLTGLPPEEAENLIIEEARARNVDLKVLDCQQLFRRTYGLPLPIKLSVARIASGETFDQVMRWLGNTNGSLPEYCLKEQIEMAHQRDINAWELLLVCSLFDQDAGVSLEALNSIVDISQADRDDGLALLQRLSLLNRYENDRFWVLPIVQAYARNELAAADFAEEVTERWLNWVLQFAQRNGVDVDLHVESVQIIGVEYLNLLAAIRWCHEHQRLATLLSLAECIWFYPYIVGLFGEFREILEVALKAAREQGDKRREGRFLRRLGLSFWVQEHYDEARVEYLEKAYEIASRYGNDAELGRVSHTLSDITYKQGNIQEAERLVEKMLDIGEQHNYMKLKALAAYRLSEFESKKLHFNEALEWLDKSERWSRELGWTRGLAWILYRRGITLIRKEDYSPAETFLDQSLSMAITWNERNLIAYNKFRLARVYASTARQELALRTAEEARDLFERLGMLARLAEVKKLLGILEEKKE